MGPGALSGEPRRSYSSSMIVALCLGVGLAGLAAGWFLAPAAERYTGELGTRHRTVTAACAGLVSAALALRFGAHPVLVAYLYFGIVCTLLTFIDLAVQRLPDPYTLPAYLAGPLLLAAAAPFTEQGFPRLVYGLIGLAALWLVYGAQHFLLPDAIGRGDVKLAGVLGLYLGWAGWASVVVGWFAAFLLGGLFAVGLLAARRAGRKSSVPFGPWMLAGAWIGLIAGDAVWDWYRALL